MQPPRPARKRRGVYPKKYHNTTFMKKIFTLALAAAAVITANAAPARKLTLRNDDARTLPRAERVALPTAPESRADVDLSGNYVDGIMQGYFDSTNEVVGQIGFRGKGFTLEADPEVENGYIIKNFLYAVFFTDDEPGEINDIKGVYNPVTKVFSIPGRQVLFEEENDEYGMIHYMMLTGNAEGKLDADLPIEFSYEGGQLHMLTTGIEFGEPYGEQGMLTVPYAVANMNAWIPNGQMTYTSKREGREVTCPIYGVNANGENMIYNFGDADPLNYVAFGRGTDFVDYKYKFNTAGYYAAAFIAYYYPSEGEDTLDYFYLTAVEKDGDTWMPVTDDVYDYYLKGDVTVNTPTECEIKFPPCALVDEQDVEWDVYTDVVVTYNPSAIVGIEAVETVDNTNAPVVYYNLQGMRVDNPQGGIFIRQQGTESTKVLIK